ncbi:hypothetical protein Droror1_Dr00024273 [Drosera rotundifolia]
MGKTTCGGYWWQRAAMVAELGLETWLRTGVERLVLAGLLAVWVDTGGGRFESASVDEHWGVRVVVCEAVGAACALIADATVLASLIAEKVATDFAVISYVVFVAVGVVVALEVAMEAVGCLLFASFASTFVAATVVGKNTAEDFAQAAEHQPAEPAAFLAFAFDHLQTY